MKNTITTVALLFFALSLCGQGAAFQDVTAECGLDHQYQFFGIMGSGVAFFDYNNDHFEDIYLTGGDRHDQLFRNNGDGTFTNVTAEAGIVYPAGIITNGVVTGDLDNDGDREIIVTSLKFGGQELSHSLLFENMGDGTFSNISISSGIMTTADGELEAQSGFSASLGDVNLDGLLDIYISNWVDGNERIRDSITNEVIGFNYTGAPNRLYLNNGDLSFTDVADLYGVTDNGCSLAGVFSDYDNDRDMDILLANDFGAWVKPDALYRNDFPVILFSDESETSGFDTELYGMSVGVGDYDRDGDLDYYKTSIGPAALMKNLSDGTFDEVAESAGVDDPYVLGDSSFLSVHFGSGFTDFNNDGWLDLAVAKGRVGFPSLFPSTDSMPNQLWRNLGDGTFEDANYWFDEPCYQLSRGLAYADFDNDGAMDLLFANSDSTAQNNGSGFPILYRNLLPEGGHWLKVKTEGTVNNRDGFGTHLTIHVGGASWLHEISGGGQGHSSQHSSVAHFGLGAAEMVDSLVVSWPGNLTPKQVFYNIPSDFYIKIIEGNNQYKVIQGEVVNTTMESEIPQQVLVYPNPNTGQFTISGIDIQNAEVSIYNSVGQLVKEAILTQSELDISGLVGGLYYLTVKQGHEVYEAKVMKQ